MKRLLAIGLIVLAVGGAAWLLWPRPPEDDRALILATIDAMAEAAEKKDIGGVLEPISARYRGEGGDRQELKSYLLGYILRSNWVSVVPANVEVTVEGTSARVNLVVLLGRGEARSAKDLPPESIVGSHAIEAEFEKESDGWRVVSASRREAGVSDWFK